MIEILNSHFRKIDILRKYSFSQYENKVRDIGTFKINAELVKENLYLVNREERRYVLFDAESLGVVESVKYSDEDGYEGTIEISGRMGIVLLTKRVIKGTINFSGIIPDYIKTLINSNFVNVGSGSDRYVNIKVQMDDYEYLKNYCTGIKKQVTGGYVWDEVQSALEQDSLALFFTPVVKPLQFSQGFETNITEWSVKISAGKDRRKGNTEGNTPVIFSKSLSNIERTEYNNNTADYCNIAYVAGEGEDEDRKWYELEVNDYVPEYEDKKGWGRSELWIDARDIQSEDSEGNVLTESEYRELIKQRANERAVENTLVESYESTITDVDRRYIYGKDYFNGDLVTVIDNDLGIVVDAQIVGVTKSEQGDEEIVDIEFYYDKIRRKKEKTIKWLKREQNSQKSNIKYLENKLEKIENKLDSGEFVGKDGVSPTVVVNADTSLTITDVNGTRTTPVLKGADGTDGADATAYRMLVNALAIGKTASGAYKQSTITLQGRRQVGSGSFTSYACRFKVETTTSANLSSASWKSRYTSSSNTSSYIYTIPSGVTGIRCSMYLAGGTTTLLDQVIVPVITDGEANTAGVKFEVVQLISGKHLFLTLNNTDWNKGYALVVGSDNIGGIIHQAVFAYYDGNKKEIVLHTDGAGGTWEAITQNSRDFSLVQCTVSSIYSNFMIFYIGFSEVSYS